MLKRLSIVLLALAVVAGSAVAPMPCAMALASSPRQATATDMPCKGAVSACIGGMGCAVRAALPASPLLPPAGLRWAAVGYVPWASALDGRSVEPELFPPIPSA